MIARSGVRPEKQPPLHGGDRLDTRCRVPRLCKRDRERLLELDRDLAALTNAFRNVGGARARIEQFHEWLSGGGGGDRQSSLPFARIVA